MHHRSGDIPAGFGLVNGEAGKFQLIKISRMPCSNLGPDRIQDWCNMTGGCALKRQDGNASCSNLRARSGALLETSTSYKVQSLWPSSLVESDNAAVERLPQARSSQAVQISADLSGRFRFRIGTRRASWSCQISRGRVLTDTCILSNSLQFDTLKGCRT